MPTKALVALVVLAGFLAPPPFARSASAQAEDVPLERRIEVGEFHLRSGRWQEAAAVFAPLAERPDASAAVFRGLGEAYMNLGRREDAVRALEEAQRRGGDERARLLLIDLVGNRPEGWPQAIELLQQQVAANPSDIDSQRRLGDLLVYENRIGEAVPVLRSVVAARPDDAEALLLYGRTLAWSGDYADAAPVFDKAIAAGGALQPDDNKWVARARESVGDSRRANELYRASLQSKPGDTFALAGLARTALELDRTEEARAAIDRLRAEARSDPSLDLTVARLDVAAGRREDALPVYVRALDERADPALAQEYADILVSVGRADEAVDVITRFPDTSAAGAAGRLRILAASPAHQQEARQLAEKLLAQTSDPEVARVARQLVVTTPNRDLSFDLVDRVARRYPGDRAVQSKLADMLLARGQNQRAEQVLSRLQSNAPKDASVVASLAATQLDNGNTAGAKKTLEQAGSLVDRDARLLSMRAGLAFGDGELAAARSDYAAALELNPRLAEARIGLAEIALAEGDTAEAEALLAAKPALPERQVADLRRRLDLRAKLESYRRQPNADLGAELEPILRAELERQPNRSDYRLTLAQIQEASGRSRDALAQFALLQNVEPPLREAYLAPVRIHMALGEQDAAEDAFARFQQVFPGEEDVAQARLFAGEGEQHKRQGDYKAALESYRKALEIAPRNVDIWNGVAGVHFQFGNPGAALDAFENAIAANPDDPAARRGRVDALTALAGNALEAGDREAANEFLDRALRASGGDAEALERTARLALSARNYDLARAAAQRLPDTAKSRELLALVDVEQDLAENLQDPQSVPAEDLLALARRGLASYPDRADLVLLEAQALERLGDNQAANASFHKAARLGATSPDVYGGQVRTYARLGDFTAANDALAELQRRAPAVAEDAEISLRLAQADAYRKAGRDSAAADAAASAVRLDPDNVGARLSLAAAAADAGDLETAIASYRAAQSMQPNSADAHLGLAGAYFKRGELEDALREYDAAIAVEPGNRDAIVARADVLAGLASSAMQSGDRARAVTYVNESLRGSRSVDAALETTAESALRIGEYDLAEDAVRELADSERRAQLARVVERERQLAEVRLHPETAGAAELALIEESLRVQPDRTDLLLIRAQTLERTGDREAALQAYQRLAKLPNPPAEAYAGQVRVLSSLGRTREAASALAAIRTNDPAAARDAELVLVLAEADKAKRAGRSREALAAAQRALVLDPDNVDVQMLLAGIYSEAGQVDDAIAAYQAVLAKRPGDLAAREALAGAYFERGELAKAAAEYDALLAADPNRTGAVASRNELSVAEAGRALNEGRVDAAEQLLDRVLTLDPQHRKALAMKLQIVVGRNDFAQARRRIDAVPDRAWRSELESWLAVEEAVARWRADKASMPAEQLLRVVDQGLRRDPNRVDLLLMRAQILEESGDPKAALAAFRRVAEQDNAPAEATAGQVRALIALERFGEAEALVDRLITLRPEAANSERAKLYHARAEALKELGQYPAAFASARDALALQPGNADTLTLLGWIYLETGQPADAMASFSAALDTRPRDLTALQGLAMAHEAAGDWQAAESVYLELAALPSGSFPADARERISLRRSFAQVEVLRAAGRNSAAVEQLEAMRQSYPRNPDVWAALSETRNALGQASLALTYADQGLQIAPESPRLRSARIRALLAAGRYQEARTALAEAEGIVPATDLAKLSHDIALAAARAERERWMRDGRLDLAYLALAEEYQLAPNDADVLRAIGYLYLETEQYPEARQFFERAVRLEPQNPAGQMGLAYALRGDGEPGLAIERIESVMQSRPSPDAALALAELYYDQGRHRDAEKMLAYAKSHGGVPRRVLPPLRIDRARAVAPELRNERGSVLPPLMLPEGVMRAVPDRPPAVPVYEEMRVPSQRSSWRDGRRLGGDVEGELSMLAFADDGAVLNDAAPPEAWAFAGPALDALRRGIASEDEPVQLAQALPSFDRVMEDVRGGTTTYDPYVPPAPRPQPSPRAGDEAIRDEYLPAYPETRTDPEYPAGRAYPGYRTERTYRAKPSGRYGTVEDYIPGAPQGERAPYAVDGTLPPQPREGSPSAYERRYRYYEYGDVAPGTAPVPEVVVAPSALPPAYTRNLYLERDPAGAGLPLREPIQPPTPLDAEARARMTALERKLQRAQTMKVSVGFRYDFLNSVSDVIADEFVLWRFPVYLEVPGLIGSRLRVTGEPTIIDNGIVTDTGVAGEVAVLGLGLGTEIVQLSFGAGVTPAGFRDGIDVTGFARLTLQLAERLTLTPFFERKPVIESLLSYRGNTREGIFFGKVMQNRFGGTLGYSTLQEINGVFEVAYSMLDGVRVEDNEKIDAFFSIGRDFEIAREYVVRPGAQAYFFHYDKDLSESYPLGLDPVLFPEDEFPRGGGYFSPDAFFEAVLRLDLRGPLMPYTFPGSTFHVGGRVGGQWISGVDAPRFASAEGSRATFGGDAGIEVPLGEVVVFSAGTGFVVADPYDRIYFEMALLFPL